MSFEFQTSDVSKVLALHVGVLIGREGSLWDEMGLCCDNVEYSMWSLYTRIEKSFSYSFSNPKVPNKAIGRITDWTRVRD